MRIATILIAYKRFYHTEQVLQGLKNGTKRPESLLIFQDGVKNEGDRDDWEKTRKLFDEIDWCIPEIIVSKENKGLNNSIINAINYTFEGFDAAIILEDDCVPRKRFIEFMELALEAYKDSDKVYSVTGFAYNTAMPQDEYTGYFCGRTCSWGWGTYRDKWKCFDMDHTIYARIMKDEDKRNRYTTWVPDIDGNLIGDALGTLQSWDSQWALHVIEEGGYCFAPYTTLITNIGFDGTGINCEKTDDAINQTVEDDMRAIRLPVDVMFRKDIEEKYAIWFEKIPAEKILKGYNEVLRKWLELKMRGLRIGQYFIGRNERNITIWGKGEMLGLLQEEFKGDVIISCIIETSPKESFYNGIPIVSIEDAERLNQTILVLPFYDMRKILLYCKEMGVDTGRILGLDEVINQMFCLS